MIPSPPKLEDALREIDEILKDADIEIKPESVIPAFISLFFLGVAAGAAAVHLLEYFK